MKTQKIMNKEKWVIEFDEDKKRFWFKRFINDKVKEQYRPCSKEEAIIWFTQAVNDSRLSSDPLYPHEPTK